MRDLWRLWRKGAVYSNVTSFVFRLAPSVYLSTVMLAVLFVPFGHQAGVLSFDGDFIFFAYLLALGKFMMIAAAMDTGSSFEGMGASREALFSLFSEPAFFALMGSFALYTGHTSFHDIFSALHFESTLSYALAAWATFLLIVLAMIENSRMPIDDPKTHLELTMIHEVMILDHSGTDLAQIMYATHLKFAMYGALVANIFIQTHSTLLSAILIFGAVQIGFAIAVGFIESFMARFRMNHNAQFIFSLTSMALLIFLTVLLISGN